MQDNTDQQRRSQNMVHTYNQYPDILIRLNLQAIEKRLVCRSKRQPITRRLHEIQRLGLQRALEFADKLVLRVAPLPSSGANVGDIVARFH
jgi:hypothetical protein